MVVSGRRKAHTSDLVLVQIQEAVWDSNCWTGNDEHSWRPCRVTYRCQKNSEQNYEMVDDIRPVGILLERWDPRWKG